MNLEDLNKSQLILLTVFVNFVVSIATGILTVSLLDQAPPVVTQTVNRIVEHTIETVAQATPAAVVAAPQPSVEDLITGAFAADEAREVSLYDAKSGTSTPALALGTYLPKARAVVTATGATLPKEVLVGFANGAYIAASLSKSDTAVTIYGFADKAELPQAPSPVLVALKNVKIGQTALALKDGIAATGIVSKITDDTIRTTLGEAEPGTAAVDLSGNLLGIASGAVGSFVSAGHIYTLLTATSSTATSTSSS